MNNINVLFTLKDIELMVCNHELAKINYNLPFFLAELNIIQNSNGYLENLENDKTF